MNLNLRNPNRLQLRVCLMGAARCKLKTGRFVCCEAATSISNGAPATQLYTGTRSLALRNLNLFETSFFFILRPFWRYFQFNSIRILVPFSIGKMAIDAVLWETTRVATRSEVGVGLQIILILAVACDARVKLKNIAYVIH